MGRRCCVPHCYTGYRKSKDRAEKETGSLFKVPDDDYFREEWNKAIAREDRLLTPKDFVCYKHFADDDFIKRRFVKHAVEEYKVPKLKPDAIPSIFPDLPDHIIKMVKKRRRMPLPIKIEEIKDEVKEEEKPHVETNLVELKTEQEISREEHLIPQIKSEPLDDVQEEYTENVGDLNLGEIQIKTEVQDEDQCQDTGPKVYKCDECDYQTTYKNNLKTHQTKHEQECKYVCKHCTKFKSKWLETYKSHLRVKHNIGPQKIYKCSLCTFQTKIQVCWKRHMDRHKKLMGRSRYSCIVCEFECDSHKVFQQHIKDHKKENVEDKTILDKFKYPLLFDILRTNINIPLNDSEVNPDGVQIKTEPDVGEEVNKEGVISNVFNPPCHKPGATIDLTSNLSLQEKIKKQHVLKCGECDFTSRTILCLKLHMKKHKSE